MNCHLILAGIISFGKWSWPVSMGLVADGIKFSFALLQLWDLVLWYQTLAFGGLVHDPTMITQSPTKLQTYNRSPQCRWRPKGNRVSVGIQGGETGCSKAPYGQRLCWDTPLLPPGKASLTGLTTGDDTDMGSSPSTRLPDTLCFSIFVFVVLCFFCAMSWLVRT